MRLVSVRYRFATSISPSGKLMGALRSFKLEGGVAVSCSLKQVYSRQACALEKKR